MSHICEQLAIDDVRLIKPQRFKDSRGYFVETYNSRRMAALGISAEFVQDNEALSEDRGTLRGLHFQISPSPQAKLVRVISGSIFDVVVDLRRGSLTYGKWLAERLSAEDGSQLFVPVGFAHGYCTLEPNTLVAYKVDGFYDKNAERGVRWDDPDIGIDWPIEPKAIKVSDKDEILPLLRDLPPSSQFEF